MTTIPPEKLAELLNTGLGEGTILMGNDPSLVVTYLPTSVLPIDLLLGGGLPRGRFTEVYGDYSTLKSYVALRAIATTQAAGGTCLLLDTEHAYDPEWLAILGGDPDTLLVRQPETGEEAVKVAEVALKSGVDLMVWDSIAASLPLAEAIKAPGEDKQPARLASFMSQSLRRLNAANSSTAVLMLNQTRTNVGITFGSSESVPGGKAMPFYASYRLRFGKAGRVTEPLKVYDGEKWIDTKQVMAQKIKVTVEKSKLSRPHRETWFVFDMTTGNTDDLGFLIAEGMLLGSVVQNGAHWRLHWWPKSKQGMAKFREAITDDDAARLLEEVRNGRVADEVEAEDPAG